MAHPHAGPRRSPTVSVVAETAGLVPDVVPAPPVDAARAAAAAAAAAGAPSRHSQQGAALIRQTWVERLARFSSSGLSVAAFCVQEGISSQAFYHWRHKLSREQQEQPSPAASAAKPPTPPRLVP